MIIGIGIGSVQVHVGIARPEGRVWLTSVGKQPDQVMERLDVGEVVEFEAPEADVLAATLLAPPEPGAACFVERTPQDGDTCVLGAGKVSRSTVETGNKGLVLSGARGQHGID